MRYAAEFRRAWEGASGKAIDAGKKLLGYLANQKRLSGVDSLVKRITLDDGTIVEARWDMNIPTVRIYPGDGTEGCELYVESGMLDLGPNIASDANERFNRGLPVFDDSPATLHFGDDVTCADGVEGLNGVVHVTQRQITSQCLPSAGPSVTSRLTSPVKKQAQAVLPASCWSGLMQRYVQAVYGGGSLEYRAASDSVLEVEGVPIGTFLSGAWGLLEIDGALQFVVMMPGGHAVFVPPKFKSPCGQAAMALWRANRNKPDAEKILSIALSDCYPSPSTYSEASNDEPNTYFSNSYTWQFSAALPEAHCVRYSEDEQRAVLLKATFSMANGQWDVEYSHVEEVDLPPSRWGCVLGSPKYGASPFGKEGELAYGESFDVPVYAYYEDNHLVVVRHYLAAEAQPVVPHEGRACDGAANNWPTPLVPDAVSCAVTRGGTGMLTTDTPGGFHNTVFDSAMVALQSGVYARRNGVTAWSTVRSFTARAMTFYETPSMTGESITYIMPAGSGGYINLAKDHESTRVVDVTYESGGAASVYLPHNRSDPYGNMGISDASIETSLSFFQNITDPKCGHDMLGHTRINSSGQGNTWEPAPSGHFYSIPPGYANGHVECQVPCFDGFTSSYRGYILMGSNDYLEFPLGDSRSLISMAFGFAGVTQYLGHEGYVVRKQGPYCNDVGNCSGTLQVRCNGDGGSHSAHWVTLNYTAPAYYGEPYAAYTPFGIPEIEVAIEYKDRLHSQWRVLAVSKGEVVHDASGEGQFEEHVDGDVAVWADSHDKHDCPVFHSIIAEPFHLDPTTVLGKDGDTSLEKQFLESKRTLLHGDFDFVFRRSLKGAVTQWGNPLMFGNSINMDRETITGGYPKVNTPSFVGWA